jgi:hypothetical protein
MVALSTLRLRTAQLILPKSGSGIEECEDAIGVNSTALRYAVADGATEAFDAGTWARQLAHNWVNDSEAVTEPEPFKSWVGGQGDLFHASWIGRPRSWYAEEKALDGSFAAFVGVQFHLEDGPPRWQAIALGDSCLIHCNGEALREVMPVSTYRDFTSTPLLVPSLRDFHAPALSQAMTGSGSIEEGDIFLLLSDAAAEWYLKSWEAQRSLLGDLESLLEEGGKEELASFFEAERKRARIKDDDIAILRIFVEGEH